MTCSLNNCVYTINAFCTLYIDKDEHISWTMINIDFRSMKYIYILAANKICTNAFELCMNFVYLVHIVTLSIRLLVLSLLHSYTRYVKINQNTSLHSNWLSFMKVYIMEWAIKTCKDWMSLNNVSYNHHTFHSLHQLQWHMATVFL